MYATIHANKLLQRLAPPQLQPVIGHKLLRRGEDFPQALVSATVLRVDLHRLLLPRFSMADTEATIDWVVTRPETSVTCSVD